MNKHIELAINALECRRGDDLYHARLAFRGLSDKEMDEQHGQSGQTRREILRGYEDSNDEINAAIDYLRRLP